MKGRQSQKGKMAESMNSRLYREVYTPNTAGNKWKEITLNTGASASTLQDIKVAESCGGYSYRDSGLAQLPTRNRFIYWKACNDVLELSEESLDLHLYSARVKFHFQDTAILGGVTIHEAQGHVIVLVPTVASVHRLIFPHPAKLQKMEYGYVATDQPVPSIFYDASIAKCMDPKNTHMLNPGGSITSHFHTAATFYTQDGEALFALASNSGSILLVKMPPLGMQGIVQQFEMSQTSVMQKLWSGLVPSMIRGGQEGPNVVTSLMIHPMRGEPYIFAVYKDHRLRVWSGKSNECMVASNLLDFCPDSAHLQSSPPAGHIAMSNIFMVEEEPQCLYEQLQRMQTLSRTTDLQQACWKAFPQAKELSSAAKARTGTIAAVGGQRVQVKRQVELLYPLGNGGLSCLIGAGHVIKKVISVNMADVRLAVHLNFMLTNMFCILQPRYTSGRLQLHHVASLFGPQEDLIDFCMTSNTVVTLWTNAEGTPVIRTLTIGDEGPGSWQKVLLQAPELADLNIAPHTDPREVYLDRLFKPGRFSKHDIRRALSVYSQALDPAIAGEAALNVNTLKQDVTVAVETEIRSAAVDYEMQEDEYYQLQLEQWTKFYSCCIQYHEVGGKLKGLFADGVTGLVGLIRKGCVTYLRPCDEVEEAYYSDHTVETVPTLDNVDDNQRRRDLLLIFEILQAIGMEMSEDLAAQFEHELSTGQNINVIAAKFVDNVILNMEDGASQSGVLSTNLGLVHDLADVINVILRAVDLSPQGDDDQMYEETDLNTTRQLSLSKFFTSKVGCDIVAASLEQFVQSRFQILRDLYLLMSVALRLEDQVDVTPALVGTIQNELLPCTANLLRAYLVVKWATTAVAVSAQATSLENNMRQLSMLDISDSVGTGNQIIGPSLIQKIEHNGASLMELFIQGPGGDQARNLLTNTKFLEEDPGATWDGGLLTFVKTLAKLVWPLSDSFVFAEFLVSYCQYLPLQEYVGLLQNWCDFNTASRCFMQGLSYLHFDEPQKAAQCFNRAREGVSRESFLKDRLLQTDETQVRKLEVLFYLKVIRQFEEFGAPDVVISLARMAISVADDDDANLPTLWSKVFKYQLELGHNTEAYNAMIENPDPSRRKDCLRQLLICLCDRHDLQSLVNFPYTDLEEEVESILESRARCMDLTMHNYYDLLYAFHIFRNNYRKAGSVMYEHGMRLPREVPGRQGLQRQAQCYLSALNALRLVKPEYSWIIKPLPPSRPNLGGGDGYLRSAKHDLEGTELDTQPSKFEILELHDIEKEFMLVDARLRLLAKDDNPALAAGPTPGADEMAGLLVNAGMFDRAVILCKAFDLSFQPVFENLALRCVNLAKNSSYHMRGDNDYTSQAWDWLKTNTLTLTNIAKEHSATDQAWQLLQQYLDRYEDGTGRYHRCTANKLMAHAFTLPSWFVNSYKGLNAAELLRLYIDYDLLEEGVRLCVEYIDAVVDTFRGQDSQLFQLKGCLQHLPQTVWLPYTSIDLLLRALQEHKQDIQLGGLYQALQDKLRVYIGRLRQATDQVGNIGPEQMYLT